MKICYSNATVMWNEEEIIRRENLIREIPVLLQNIWVELNPMIRMSRCETPILTPIEKLEGHRNVGFELIGPCGTRGYLRPETTRGTYEALDLLYSDSSMLKKRLPYCLWQVGLSFRDEKNTETMRASKLRLVQFYQIEFQLFCSHGTKAPYLEHALARLIESYGGKIVEPESLPHYSIKTLDWQIDELEVAGCSIRNDWQHGMVFEIAIGLDRLVALQMAK